MHLLFVYVHAVSVPERLWQQNQNNNTTNNNNNIINKKRPYSPHFLTSFICHHSKGTFLEVTREMINNGIREYFGTKGSMFLENITHCAMCSSLKFPPPFPVTAFVKDQVLSRLHSWSDPWSSVLNEGFKKK